MNKGRSTNVGGVYEVLGVIHADNNLEAARKQNSGAQGQGCVTTWRLLRCRNGT